MSNAPYIPLMNVGHHGTDSLQREGNGVNHMLSLPVVFIAVPLVSCGLSMICL